MVSGKIDRLSPELKKSKNRRRNQENRYYRQYLHNYGGRMKYWNAQANLSKVVEKEISIDKIDESFHFPSVYKRPSTPTCLEPVGSKDFRTFCWRAYTELYFTESYGPILVKGFRCGFEGVYRTTEAFWSKLTGRFT